MIDPGKLDRSPCGTGCSARMALLRKQGLLHDRETFIGRSILDTEFECRIEATKLFGEYDAIVPMISGSAWITGHHTYFRHEDDPFPRGYRLSDTWPNG